MKKLILLVVLLQNLAFGQYQSLFSDSITTWDIMEDKSNLDDPYYPMYQLFIDHDTIDVNGDTMYFIVSTSNQSNYPNESYYLKENSDHSKVWKKRNYGDTTWLILYDLTLNVGDLCITPDFANTPQALVDSVYFDAQNRKHIRFNQNTFISGKFEFIEGVGTSYGLHRSVFSVPFRKPTLICQHKSGVLNYSLIHPLVANCQTSLGTDELTVNNLVIAPNPSNDWIVISSENTLQWETITIMNTIGQIVSSAPYTSEPINISGYEKGMYMLILANSKMSVKERFVKQ